MVDWEKWIYKKGVELLEHCGVQPGDELIEFGSGEGDYTLPAAILIGKQGKTGTITAIDKDGYELNQLKTRAKDLGIKNIKTLETEGGLSIEKEGKSVDGILVFDVLHYFAHQERATLYDEAFRVLKPNGLFITFPQHYRDSYPLWKLSDLSLSEIIDEIEIHGFSQRKKWEGKLIHDHSWYNGIVLSFEKVTR
jgi:ubiquinone/menaquinone biosynthesis C-methylase UbiE